MHKIIREGSWQQSRPSPAAAYYTQAGKGPEYYSSAAGMGGMEPSGTWTGAGYPEALKAEPEATAERRAELRDEAKAQVRQAVPYFDVTFSPSKSITLLHASFMANMSAALDRGSLRDAG